MHESLGAKSSPSVTSLHRLSRLLAPKSIALIGASPRQGSVGNMMVRCLQASGFTGDRYLVNPNYDTVEGLPCLDTLGELPTVPDLVVAGVGGGRLEATLDQAIALGAGGVVIFDACHGERPAGGSLLARLREKAAEANLPVCGGNGMGFLNLTRRCHASFYTASHLKPGGITLIAHSGSVFTVLALNDPRYRFNLVVSSGQEIGAAVDEYLDYALDQAETKVAALFMEGVRRPEKFAAALEKAQDRGIPVVVCKVGRTEESARLASSHSGALAGSGIAFDALLARYGALGVNTVDELMNTAMLLAQGRVPGPGGLSVVTDSGGLREALIDRADAHGSPLAELSQETKASLAARLPEPLHPSNPQDAAGLFAEDFAKPFEDALQILAAAPETAVLGYEFDARDDFVYEPKLAALAARLPEMTDKPCFVFSSFSQAHNRQFSDDLADLGIPVINGADEMLSAVANVLRWRDMKAELATPERPTSLPEPKVVAKWRNTVASAERVSEAAGLALLKEFGLATVPFLEAEDWPAVLEASASLGFPLALKTAAEGLEHKSDVDGVRLNLTDLAALEAAYGDVSGRLGKRVIVQPMAPKGVEMAFGCVVDPQFGCLVMVAAGGTLIEVLSDRQWALAPFGPAHARRMIDKLICRPLLDGQRGSPPADLEALSQAFAQFSRLSAEMAEVADSIDVNPLIVGPDGVMAVDALVIPRQQTTE